MPLSCECDEWDGDGIGWYVPSDFSELKTKKSKRCKSCGIPIRPEDTVLEFERFHYPSDEIEIKIYGDDGSTEIPNASWFLCAVCGEIFLNLDDLNFCVRPDENMNELLEVYRTEIIIDNGLFNNGRELNA